MACRDWSHILTMTTRVEVDNFLKGKTVARLNQRQQRSGLRINYQCKHRKRFGCDYQIYVLDAADSEQIHVFESGVHDHTGNSFLPGFRHGLNKQQKEIADNVSKRPYMNKAKDAAKTMLNLGIEIPNEVQLRNYMSYEKAKYKYQTMDNTSIYHQATNPIHNNNNNQDNHIKQNTPVSTVQSTSQLLDSLPTFVTNRHFASLMGTSGAPMEMDPPPPIVTDNGHNGETTPHRDDFSPNGDEDGPISPSLRRSTRVSALRAQERLRGEMTQEELKNLNDEAQMELLDDQPATKARRLAKDHLLDPTDPHFAIQLLEDGDVVLLSDDSDISSLHEDELLQIKKSYEKLVSNEPSPEVVKERENYIKMLQAELRLEEAKLVMLKRMKLSQTPNREVNPNGMRPNQSTNPVNRPQVQQYNKMPNNTANRPAVTANMVKGNQPQQKLQQMGQVKGVPPRPAMPAHQGRPQMPPLVQGTQRTGTPPALQNKNSNIAHAQRPPEQTPQQREAAAKLLMRKQLEKTLLSIPPPKPPTPEMHFIPNPNQPDFVYYLGLDLTVQRVLKDKMERTKPPTPYLCTQCNTDFTPMWKALGTGTGQDCDSSEYKLMCEACVRANQKKELKVDHTTRLKQAFVKALQQEQEIAQQIQEGKLQFPAASAPAQSSSPAVTSLTTSRQGPSPMTSNKPRPTDMSQSTSSNSNTNQTSTPSRSHQQTSQAQKQQAAALQQQLQQAAALGGLFNRSPMNPASLAAAFQPMAGFNPSMLFNNPMMRIPNPMAFLQAAAAAGTGNSANQQQQNQNNQMTAALAALAMQSGGMLSPDVMRNLTQDLIRQQQLLAQQSKQQNRK